MKCHTLFSRKLGKMLKHVSSAAVVIGALRVNYFVIYFRDFLDKEERDQIWRVLDDEKGILKRSYTVSA